MEKIVKAFLLTLVVLGLTGVASAATTVDVYQIVTTSPPFATNYTWGSGGVGSHYPIQWQHTWEVPDDVESIASASLVVTATAAAHTESTFLDGASGPFLGDLVTGPKSFDLLAHESLLDGDLTVYVELFDVAGEFGTVRLASSELRITYNIGEEQEPPGPGPEPVIPAPGAILLGSLGAGLVGWLRRRGTV